MLDFASHLELNQILVILLQALLTFQKCEKLAFSKQASIKNLARGRYRHIGDTHTLPSWQNRKFEQQWHTMSFKNKSSETVLL